MEAKRHLIDCFFFSRLQALRSFSLKPRAFKPKPASNFLTLSGERFELFPNQKLEFYANAGNGGEDGVDEAESLARGESTMPERFRYLTKEAPDPPVSWPFFVGELLHMPYSAEH
ncbi:hypothetical protein V6N11_081352 [Hibiscus sabdariffa]|uniref:Uncharacterized protein n=1 Tax=Hibiscus sabdariffa TaxID=183260 RepID=A0ABR2QJM6_9ROSI